MFAFDSITMIKFLMNKKIYRLTYNLFLFLYLIWMVRKSDGEVYTAVADLKSLIHTEKYFNKFVNVYLKAETKRLQKIQELLDTVKNSSAFTGLNETFVRNPINAYHLSNHLIHLKSSFFKLMANTSMSELLFKYKINNKNMTFATVEDLNGVAVAINRLIDTYDFNVSSIANGQIAPGVNLTKKLTANDCILIAEQLYLSKMFFKSLPWFEHALQLSNTEEIKLMNNSEIIKLFASAAFQASQDKRTETIADSFTYAFTRIEETLKQIDSSNNKNYSNMYQEEMKNVKNSLRNIDLTKGDLSYQYIHFEYTVNDLKMTLLCRKYQLLSADKKRQLKCYYMRNKSYFLIIQPTKVEDVHLKPWVALFHDIISDKEIELIKELSTPGLVRAEIGNGGTSDFRISKSSWLEDFDHPLVYKITKRLQEITGLNVEIGAEVLQIVNYGVGGYYTMHNDYDQFLEVGTCSDEMPLGNRIATVLIYLSKVTAGGATVFPNLDIAVFPQKGSAVFWYNLLKTGKVDTDTNHAACPVLLGSKWVSNKWIVEHHQEFRRKCGLTEKDIY